MSSKPLRLNSRPTPVSGTAAAPVNAIFTGPNAQGFLEDLPPKIGDGTDANFVHTGLGPPKLGLGTEVSPKTHG
jgi:hypothetical protein